jgi:CheY-like chemotaxis protein
LNSEIVQKRFFSSMDGYETIQQIRLIPHFQTLPFIAVTAKAMKDDRDKCIQAGAPDEYTIDAYSTCLGLKLFSLFSDKSFVRINILFKDVLNSCDILAKNSDL